MQWRKGTIATDATRKGIDEGGGRRGEEVEREGVWKKKEERRKGRGRKRESRKGRDEKMKESEQRNNS